ncbi:hypothetical protein [Aquirufa regiilacus]|uniref:Outer membrane protein beta-barrel domain-containing protein n=1 Tax=Aquirufa regiilacus TaxID=3024868 RepID=A0ABU3TQV4_9BACT|nr:MULTISPECIES: hypothetical protein [unclassified Aquirufa]MDT8886797.1 hypothetical protein [Aquirufa sp. LEPPI-3A]MDU0808238.1 hypothetical protein [Aquirufa sp. LEOWEIH-7C]
MKSAYIRIILCFALMLSSEVSFGQLKDWAAGFRVGEPGGFMARKYSENGVNAIEVNIGTYGGLWGTDRNYQDGTFQNIGFSINALYLWHHPTLVNADLHTYYGFGPQINSRDWYPNKVSNNQADGRNRVSGMGATAIGGLEYFPIDAPNLSFFSEIGFYAEIFPSPFFMNLQGGLGVRVNF